MNVFRYELRQYRRSILAWSLAVMAATVAFQSAASMFLAETSSLKSMLASFPQALRDAMSIDLDTFFSEVGFFSYIMVYLALTAAIQAMGLGLGIISKENRMKTADFLLSKPYSRSKVYLQKLLAALCVLVVTEAAFILAAFLSVQIQTGGDFPARPFALVALTFPLLQLIYFPLGLFLATVARKIKSPLTVTMGVCFGTFLIGMISSIAGSEALRYLSPLKYFDSGYILLNRGYEARFVLLGAGLAVAFTGASYVMYVRKDVRAVT